MSQQRTEAAIAAGYFDREIAPVTVTVKKQPVVISKDEFPKSGTTVEQLAKLKTVFLQVKFELSPLLHVMQGYYS